MTVMDIITMTIVITSQVWLAMNLAGENFKQIVYDALGTQDSFASYGLLFFLLLIAGYLLVLMVILFCITAAKSIFFKMRISGLLAFLLGCACFYVVNLLSLILAPFGEVQRLLFFIMITITPTAVPVLILLFLLEVCILFVITSKLLERKVNL